MNSSALQMDGHSATEASSTESSSSTSFIALNSFLSVDLTSIPPPLPLGIVQQ
jgi:hypothetical protein